MTPEQIRLVQSTWQAVLPIKDQAAELFYGKLFDLDPSLKKLFKSDIKEQGRKLMATLSVAVNALGKLDTILPTVQELGRRHVRYGVRGQDYATVATALLWTLEQGLGAAFTPEVRESWTAAYTTLATVMKQAAVSEAA